jgi:hypothetical protein
LRFAVQDFQLLVACPPASDTLSSGTPSSAGRHKAGPYTRSASEVLQFWSSGYLSSGTLSYDLWSSVLYPEIKPWSRCHLIPSTFHLLPFTYYLLPLPIKTRLISHVACILNRRVNRRIIFQKTEQGRFEGFPLTYFPAGLQHRYFYHLP